MRAIDKLCGGSAKEAEFEIICEQCPQNYKQFEHLPQICGGDFDNAIIRQCTECWNQEVRKNGNEDDNSSH